MRRCSLRGAAVVGMIGLVSPKEKFQLLQPYLLTCGGQGWNCNPCIWSSLSPSVTRGEIWGSLKWAWDSAAIRKIKQKINKSDVNTLGAMTATEKQRSEVEEYSGMKDTECPTLKARSLFFFWFWLRKTSVWRRTVKHLLVFSRCITLIKECASDSTLAESLSFLAATREFHRLCLRFKKKNLGKKRSPSGYF